MAGYPAQSYLLLTSPVMSSIRVSTALSNSSVKSWKASSSPGTASTILSQVLAYYRRFSSHGNKNHGVKLKICSFLMGLTVFSQAFNTRGQETHEIIKL